MNDDDPDDEEMSEHEYEDDEPVGSCDTCGCNLYRDDETLCDQCAWWLSRSGNES